MPIVFAINNVVVAFTLATIQDHGRSVWKGMFTPCTPNASTKGAKTGNIVLEGSSLHIHPTLSLYMGFINYGSCDQNQYLTTHEAP